MFFFFYCSTKWIKLKPPCGWIPVMFRQCLLTDTANINDSSRIYRSNVGNENAMYNNGSQSVTHRTNIAQICAAAALAWRVEIIIVRHVVRVRERRSPRAILRGSHRVSSVGTHRRLTETTSTAAAAAAAHFGRAVAAVC